MNKSELENLQKRARQDGVDLLVGALIMRSDGKIFAQRRSFTRILFPGCWDIAGGHVERGEWLYEALSREVTEETGWLLKSVLEVVGIFEWSKNYGAISRNVREIEFLVRVENEDVEPTLETDLVSEYRWIGPHDLKLLSENRKPGDTFMTDVFREAFETVSKSHRIVYT